MAVPSRPSSGQATEQPPALLFPRPGPTSLHPVLLLTPIYPSPRLHFFVFRLSLSLMLPENASHPRRRTFSPPLFIPLSISHDEKGRHRFIPGLDLENEHKRHQVIAAC